MTLLERGAEKTEMKRQGFLLPSKSNAPQHLLGGLAPVGVKANLGGSSISLGWLSLPLQLNPFRLWFWLTLLTALFLSSCENNPSCAYQEGDFWRNKEFEDWGYIVKEQNFSHIIYEAPDGQLWTQCHSHIRWLKLEEAHKVIVDNRANTTKRLEWEFRQNNKNIWQKILEQIRNNFDEEPPMIVMVQGRILDYEELYYCDECFRRFSNSE